MSIDKKVTHSFDELKTRIVDKALFGDSKRYVATVSWIDLYREEGEATYHSAVQFLKRYMPGKPTITDFAPIMTQKDMQHRYDNAFRIEVLKDRSYDQNLY